MTDTEDKTAVDDDMRLVLSGAADILLTYALSDAFDWQRDKDILRPVVQGCEKLTELLDARKAS